MSDIPDINQVREAVDHYDEHQRRYPDWRLMPETAAILAVARAFVAGTLIPAERRKVTTDEMVWAMFSAIAEELSTDPDNPEIQPGLLAVCRRGLDAALAAFQESGEK